MQIREVCTDIW